MITKFGVSSILFAPGRTLEEVENIYKKYYKPAGYIFDRENENIFKVFNKEINLSEGDKVRTDCRTGILKVNYKLYDAEDDTMIYELEEEC